jgi:hypothetical protein
MFQYEEYSFFKPLHYSLSESNTDKIKTE